MTAGLSLAEMPAVEMAARVADRRVSPVEITQAVLARIEALEPRLNAFAALDADRAMEAAREAERAVMRRESIGPLHGVPVTIKDIQAVRGLPTRRGTRLSDPAPAVVDAPVVARLRAAGAIILGKTTMPEHGWTATSDSPLTGSTHNPWRRGLTAGGSSSGGAALAGGGCGPLHLGSDGAGSVRLPAHFCGVIGFKPTFGTVPYVPVPNNGSLSHLGPLARDIPDAALMMSVMTGWHPSDPTTLAAGMRPLPCADGGLPGLRIAYSPDLGHAQVDREVADCIRLAAKRFEALGCTVEEMSPSWGPSGPALIRDLWGAAFLPVSPLDDAGWDALDPHFAACLRDAASLTLRDVAAAQGRRLEYSRLIGEWFDRGWDLLLTPSASTVAFPVGGVRPPHWASHPWDWLAWAEFSYPFNLSHGPAISIPCGLTRSGLPMGLQLASARHSDALVLKAAHGYLTAHPAPTLPLRNDAPATRR